MRHIVSSRSFSRQAVACSAFALGLLSSAAMAQVAPSTIDPGQTIRRFEQPDFRPSVSPEMVIQREGDESTLQGGSTEKAFTLQSVSIDGSTVYNSGELNSVYSSYIGQPVSFADLQAIANQLTAKYREDGYILSRVILPPQRINGGAVQFQVIEGYVSNVEFTGKARADDELMHKYAEKIKAQRPLKAATLERYLLLMDDLPGITARSVLRPAADGQGASTLSVDVDDKSFEGDVAFDNFGNKFLGPYQITAVAAFNSVFDEYDRNTVRVLTTADFEEVWFGEYTHEHQIGSEGGRLSGRVAYSEVNPGASLEPFDIEGKTGVLEATYLHPFLRSRNENLNFIGKFRAQNTTNDILGFELYDDHVRVASVGMEYDNVDPIGGINQLRADMNQGVNLFDATSDGAGRSRVLADHNFTSLTASYTRIQEFTETWSLYMLTEGQYTNDSLLSSEQYALGGRRIGRAFDSAELLGDKGLSGLLELRYGDVYDMDSWFHSYQLYAFYDVGSVWLNQPLVGEEKRESLSSTGLGVRFNLAEDVSGGVELSLPLNRDVSSTGDDDPRLFFNIVKRF